jgi:hypothetical protein
VCIINCTEYEGELKSSDEIPFSESLKILKNHPKPLQNQDNCDIINIDADEEWITVNGAAVPIKDGELKGAVGEKIAGNAAQARGEIKSFKPTAANTKDFKAFTGSKNPYPWVNEAKDPDKEIEALEVDGKVAGLISTRFNATDKKDFGAVYISLVERAGNGGKGKDGENKGVGKQLIAHACRKAEKLGVNVVYLEPATTAIPYYQSIGFKSAGMYMMAEGAAFDKLKGG